MLKFCELRLQIYQTWVRVFQVATLRGDIISAYQPYERRHGIAAASGTLQGQHPLPPWERSPRLAFPKQKMSCDHQPILQMV